VAVLYLARRGGTRGSQTSLHSANVYRSDQKRARALPPRFFNPSPLRVYSSLESVTCRQDLQKSDASGVLMMAGAMGIKRNERSLCKATKPYTEAGTQVYFL
jgi:hypothetical protein